MRDRYRDRSYLEENPTWHEEDSPWKAQQILGILEKNRIAARTVAEVGCGVGGVLAALYEALPAEVEFSGFDIAPEAIARAQTKQRERLHFYQEDPLQSTRHFDLLLIIDVVEHVPDYLGFLSGCRGLARYKLYHIPLDLDAQSLVRGCILKRRATVGHLHYFTAEWALVSLTDTGHRILDFRYTDGVVALAPLHPSLKRTLVNVPRRMLSRISTALSARLLGGYSLLVLCE